MDFARKQLEKYGWTDGKGLGKNENGISEAIKPKLKRSVTGIGHDAAKDFTEHWWKQLYDKAAGNVQVEEKNGKTKKIKTKDDKFKITNSTWRLKQKPSPDDTQESYSEYFVKSAILTNDGSRTEKVTEYESEDGEKETVDFKMTDEELFAACEGRTAHKGARHGLKAIGKLARIQRQEQLLLTQPQYNGYSQAKKIKNKVSVKDLQVVEDMSLSSDGDSKGIKKKKKRKRCLSNAVSVMETEMELGDCEEPLPENYINKKVSVASVEIKKSKKCKRKNDDEIMDVISNNKKYVENQEIIIETELTVGEEQSSIKKVKKNKKKLAKVLLS